MGKERRNRGGRQEGKVVRGMIYEGKEENGTREKGWRRER